MLKMQLCSHLLLSLFVFSISVPWHVEPAPVLLEVGDSFYVAANNDSTTASVPCGTSEHHRRRCQSLEDALETVYILRSSSSSSSGGASLSHDIIIRLMSSNETNCAVEARTTALNSSDPALISVMNRASLRVVIEGDQSRGCFRTHIAASYQDIERDPSYYSKTSNRSFVYIFNSSLIVFKHITLSFRDAGPDNALRALVDIQSSIGISFDNVHFPQRSLQQVLVNTSCSSVLKFRACLFDGRLVLALLGGHLDSEQQIVAAVQMHISDGCEEHVEELDDSTVPSTWLETVWSPLDQARSKDGKIQTQAALFFLCQFVAIGGNPGLMDQNLNRTDPYTATGIALYIVLSEAQRYHLSILDCTFDFNRSPRTSPVGISFGSAYSKDNIISIRKCRFISNEGMQSGAVLSHFSPSAANNILEIDDTVFDSNVGRNEGGGVGIYFAGQSAKLGNQVHIRNARFIENQAGVFGFPTPGGAIIAVAEYDPACSRETPQSLSKISIVHLENCSVLDNVGFGAIHIVRTTIVFGGSK